MDNAHIEPKLEERVAQPYVSIPVKASLREWDKATVLVSEVVGWLGSHGLVPAGAPFFRYWTIGDLDTPFDLEVGFPVEQELKGDERVRPGYVPAGCYLVWQHYGHPDQLYSVHERLQRWAAERQLEIKKQGHDNIWNGRFDFYLTNPEEEPDPNLWTTEIAYRLKDGTPCGR